MSAEKDRASQEWVARRFGTAKENVKAMTDRGEIPFLRIHEGVRRNGETFTEYRYSKSQIEAYFRRRGELDAESAARAFGGAA